MSEYQYYEFQTLDRPLTARQIRELRKLSTRAEITPTQFVNEYHWGDFRGDPRRLMEKYFDAFVYFANWGTRRFMLRFPRNLIDVPTLREYGAGDSFSVKVKGNNVLVEFYSAEEEGFWKGNRDWLAGLIPLRTDLVRGDYRSLYLGWLLGVQNGEVGTNGLEPPPPPGLDTLSPPLEKFVAFFEVDQDLIDAAAKTRGEAKLPDRSREELATWVKTLSGSEKDSILLRLVAGEGPQLGLYLEARFRRDREKAAQSKVKNPKAGIRSITDLLKARDLCKDERKNRESLRLARKRAREARKKARARAEHLDALAGRETEAWQRVESHIESKVQERYDQAVELLKDLRELGSRENRVEPVDARIREIRERHAKKYSLMRRFDESDLMGEGGEPQGKR